MGKGSLRDHRTGRTKTRSQGMIAMNQRGGDGYHGGDKHVKNKRDRLAAKRNLKGGVIE